MDSYYEIEPYRLAGEHTGKWALTITRLSKSGTDEQPLLGGPIFQNEHDALQYGIHWVTSRRGQVRKTVLRRVADLTN